MKAPNALIVSLFIVGSFGLLGLFSATASAIDVWGACSGVSGDICESTTKDNAQSMIKPIVATTLTILGAVAVIMIIIGGIMYTISAGDPGKTKKAKDTVLYSVIGLVVALLAYGIIEFVIGRVG